MPPFLLPFLFESKIVAASVVGERIDGETCDGVATGED